MNDGMNSWNFPGARWWKFDFHTHTPVSNDSMQGCSPEDKNKVTPEFWLQKFMEKGIDCIAITDHNSGAWIGELKTSLQQIHSDNPAWYRPLYLFPGVEISANGSVHILAIFDPEKTTGDIDRLLGAVGYEGTKGTSNTVTTKSVTEVVNEIVNAGGLAIPAHADKEKGLLRTLQGNSLKQVLDNSSIYAMELADDNYTKPQLYIDEKTNWTEVRGSDTHNFRSEKFGDFTWVKMDKPSIEGLKLALIDGCASVNRNMAAQPNKHAEFVIESIKISEAQYMGRGNESLVCKFSPFLNTIIGGRGSGKSTLLEFMRFALRREKELPDRLTDDYKKYFNTDEGGLLTEDSILQLVYRKGDTRYRLNWAADPQDPSLEECDETTEEWQGVDGEIPSLFPARIYSQKQIFNLAQNPQGLLGIIDEVPEVEFDAYRRAFQDCANSCKKIAQQQNRLQQKIAEENKLKGQLNDLSRQIEQVEKSGHKDILRNYQLRKQQLNEIEQVEQHWRALLENMGEVLADTEIATVNQNLFDAHPKILSALQKKQEQWKQQIDKIRQIIEIQTADLQQWQQDKAQLDWMKTLNVELQQYQQLHARFEQQGIDPQTYPDLLRRRALVEKELQQIVIYRQQRDKLTDQYNKEITQAKSYRSELTERRQQFLERVLAGNLSVRISVKPFAESWLDMEKQIRGILQTGGRFGKDIEALKQIIDEKEWEQAKERVIAIRGNKKDAKDVRFQTHLQGLPAESMTDMRLWFPEDALQITYGENDKKISEGSPGQKSAALLAFILVYGDEPLLLDQPEDDLDNDLIYSLIVQDIRATKTNRQIVVVTHNANIVVNGDAEMVHCLTVTHGQSHITSGSLQSKAIRERICNTLEGGDKAFEQRYKRIHLES